jgi:hypothetical protein
MLSGMGHLPLSLRNHARILSVLLAVATSACDDTSNAPAPVTQVALALPAGWVALEVAWVVHRADGSTVATGTEDVGVPQDTLSLGFALPAGQGNILYLNVLTASGVTCNGTSAPFDVIPGVPGDISVAMSCQTTDYAQNGCPAILVQGPTPPAATVPDGTVSVAVTAGDPDGTAVPSLAWVATGGKFSDTTAGSTLYTCSTAGTQTIFLTVTDQVPSGCSTTFLLPVTCLP